MSYLFDSDSLNSTILIQKQQGTKVTLDTAESYVDKDIELTVNVSSGFVETPDTQITANPTISFDNNSGLITSTITAAQSIIPTISTAGWVEGNGTYRAGLINVSGSNTYQVPQGSIVNNTTGGTSSGIIHSGNQIKIGAGFYSDDVYYTAQEIPSGGNTGTLNITASGVTSCDGYAYASVPSENPSFAGGTISGSVESSGTNCTLSSTNNSGISITTTGAATRGAVTYDGAANGWVTKSSGDTALAQSASISLTPVTYYLNSVNLVAPESGTRTFSVIASKGENLNPLIVTFTIDSESNVTIEGIEDE